MADQLNRTNLIWLIRVGIVVAVVLGVLLVRSAGEDDAPDPDATDDSPSSATPSAPSTPSTKVDPAAFCEQFRTFADAQSQYVAAPEDPQAEETLVEAGDTLFGPGPTHRAQRGRAGEPARARRRLPGPGRRRDRDPDRRPRRPGRARHVPRRQLPRLIFNRRSSTGAATPVAGVGSAKDHPRHEPGPR